MINDEEYKDYVIEGTIRPEGEDDNNVLFFEPNSIASVVNYFLRVSNISNDDLTSRDKLASSIRKYLQKGVENE